MNGKELSGRVWRAGAIRAAGVEGVNADERSHEAIRWDAEAELALAGFIGRYLTQHQAPAGSAVAHDLRRWSEAFQRDARARLADLGRARHLHAVS